MPEPTGRVWSPSATPPLACGSLGEALYPHGLRWQFPAVSSFIPSCRCYSLSVAFPGALLPLLCRGPQNTHMEPMPVTWLTCHPSLSSASLELKLGAGTDAQTQRKAPVARDSGKGISTWANREASAQGPSPFISGLHC